MNYEQKMQLEKDRIKLSIKSMYFNRYLLVRYVTALFFFTNFYWMVSLGMSNSPFVYLPLGLMAIIVISVAEQVKIYSSHTNNAKFTRFCYQAMLVANILLIIPTCLSSSFAQLYPFFVNDIKSKVFVLSVLVAGILLSVLMLHRLNQIKQNKDKQYQRIKEYEKAVKFK